MAVLSKSEKHCERGYCGCLSVFASVYLAVASDIAVVLFLLLIWRKKDNPGFMYWKAVFLN